MAVHVTVELRGTAEESATWLTERWAGFLEVALHLPLEIREALPQHEWLRSVGHWPTFSVMPRHGEATSIEDHELIEEYRFIVKVGP